MHNVASLQHFPPNCHSVQVTIWPNCLSHANHWQSLPNDWLNTFPSFLCNINYTGGKFADQISRFSANFQIFTIRLAIKILLEYHLITTLTSLEIPIRDNK